MKSSFGEEFQWSQMFVRGGVVLTNWAAFVLFGRVNRYCHGESPLFLIRYVQISAIVSCINPPSRVGETHLLRGMKETDGRKNRLRCDCIPSP